MKRMQFIRFVVGSCFWPRSPSQKHFWSCPWNLFWCFFNSVPAADDAVVFVVGIGIVLKCDADLFLSVENVFCIQIIGKSSKSIHQTMLDRQPDRQSDGQGDGQTLHTHGPRSTYYFGSRGGIQLSTTIGWVSSWTVPCHPYQCNPMDLYQFKLIFKDSSIFFSIIFVSFSSKPRE